MKPIIVSLLRILCHDTQIHTILALKHKICQTFRDDYDYIYDLVVAEFLKSRHLPLFIPGYRIISLSLK